MRFPVGLLLSVALLPGSLVMASAAGAEVSGEDYPLFPRYPNAELQDYRTPSLDRILIPTGPVRDADAPAAAQTIEGRLTHFDYWIDPGVATLQVARYYEGVLRSAGFDVIFSCVGDKECGGDMWELISLSGKVAPKAFPSGYSSDRMRVMVARRGDDWALFMITGGSGELTKVYEAVVDHAPTMPAATATGAATAAAGPQVHTSEAEDVTDCSQLYAGGVRTVAGAGLGALAGRKVAGGPIGMAMGAQAAMKVGQELDRKAECGPDADIESNAAAADAPKKKKKKFGLKSLLGD